MATDTKRIIELLDKAEVFYLATVDGDQPKCRPISFKMERDGRVWFGVGTFKEVYRQLKVNPKCEFVGMLGGKFFRYFGTAVFDEDPTLMADALEALPMLKNIYNDETGNVLGMFYLDDATFEIRSLFKVEETVEA